MVFFVMYSLAAEFVFRAVRLVEIEFVPISYLRPPHPRHRLRRNGRLDAVPRKKECVSEQALEDVWAVVLPVGRAFVVWE